MGLYKSVVTSLIDIQCFCFGYGIDQNMQVNILCAMKSLHYSDGRGLPLIFFTFLFLWRLHHLCLPRHCHGPRFPCLVHGYLPIYKSTYYFFLLASSPFVYMSKGHVSYSRRTSLSLHHLLLLIAGVDIPMSHSWTHLPLLLDKSLGSFLVYKLTHACSCPLASSMHNLHSNLVSFSWTCCLTEA